MNNNNFTKTFLEVPDEFSNSRSLCDQTYQDAYIHEFITTYLNKIG